MCRPDISCFHWFKPSYQGSIQWLQYFPSAIKQTISLKVMNQEVKDYPVNRPFLLNLTQLNTFCTTSASKIENINNVIMYLGL